MSNNPGQLSELRQLPYELLQHNIQVGDIIAFGGNSLFSRWAKLTTSSEVTHLALVIESAPHPDKADARLNQIIEATSYRDKNAVMVNPLCERIASYDGNVWWLPLNEKSREKFERNQVICLEFLKQQLNKPYDIWQLYGSTVDATDNMPILGSLSRNEEDFSRWFCSELIAAALTTADLIGKINASEVTPIDICQFALYQNSYTQIVGPATAINGFNTLAPALWRDTSF